VSTLSDYDRGLVRAYRESYRAAGGGEDPEEDVDVLALLRGYGVVTERHAEIVGRGQAMAEAGDEYE